MADFQQALQWLKEGKKVRLKSWRFGHESYLFIEKRAHSFEVDSIFHSSLVDPKKPERNEERHCCLNLHEFESNNWEIYEDNKFGNFEVIENGMIRSLTKNNEVICMENELDNLEKAIKRAKERC